MRIDRISTPTLAGKSVPQFLAELERHCLESAKVIMTLANEIEDLKRKVSELERR